MVFCHIKLESGVARTPWAYCSNALVPIDCSRFAQRDCMGCFVNGNNGVYECQIKDNIQRPGLEKCSSPCVL